MWYRQAKKFNIFGLPISGDLQISQFAAEDEETITDETPLQTPEIQEPELEDPTPEDEFTPQDLEQKVEQMTEDPTAGLQLPPLHNNCRCRIKTLPFRIIFKTVSSAFIKWSSNCPSVCFLNC